MGDGDRPSLADQRDVQTVYQPAEDSKLLADIAVDYPERDEWVLDAGTGSGYIAHRIGEETDARVVGSDINPNACRQAREAGVCVVRADQLTSFREAVFDVVVFNPPYLPTNPTKEWNDWMEKALSGGENGREVIEPFLDDLRRVLAPDGDAFVLISSLTGIDAVRNRARSNGLTTMIVEESPQPYERLVVLHLRPSGGSDAR
jgi:release factor glutamine methyltransferase